MSIPVLQKTLLEGKTVAWREAGDGDTLVLLHGIGGNSESWKEQLNQMCDQYRVIAWDMPGYGGSDSFGSSAPDVNEYSETLAALLNFLDVKKAHILGQSIAALIAARFCVRNPDRITSYLFAHGLTGLGSLEEEAREKAKRGRIEIFEALGPKRFAREKGAEIMSTDVSQAASEVAVGIMAEVKPAGFRQAVEMLSTANLFEDTALIQVPSLILCGADDPIASENICRTVVAALPDAQFCLIPGVGHYSATEDPEKFNQAVLSFLDTVVG